MDTNEVKTIISEWFYKNRPDIEEVNGIDNLLVNTVFKSVENDIKDLERDATLIIVREHLKQNYTSQLFLDLEDIVTEDEFSKIFSHWKEIGFLYNSEMGTIMEIIKGKDVDITDKDVLRKEVRQYLINQKEFSNNK